MKQLLKAGTAGAVGAIVAVLALFGGTALAGTGVGGVFNLGQTNTVNAQTALTGSPNASLLKLTNTATGAGASGATGLNLTVPTGRPPFVTNGTGKVANLQADTVDGESANELARVASVSNIDASWNEEGRTVLQTVTMRAPRPGSIVLSGTASPSYFSGCAQCFAHLRFHDVEANTDTAASASTITQAGITQTVPLGVTVTVPVTAGTHTFQLVGSWFDGGPTTTVAPSTWYDRSATAMFFRFNGAGTSALSSAAVSKPARRAPGGSLAQQ